MSNATSADQVSARRTAQPCRGTVITEFLSSKGPTTCDYISCRVSLVGRQVRFQLRFQRVNGISQKLPDRRINLHKQRIRSNRARCSTRRSDDFCPSAPGLRLFRNRWVETPTFQLREGASDVARLHRGGRGEFTNRDSDSSMNSY